MFLSRRIDPDNDSIEKLKAGNFISYPKEQKFKNMCLSYRRIAKDFAVSLLEPLPIKQETENKMLTMITSMCKETQMAHAVYKHDDMYFLVTLYHSIEYINSL